MVTDLILLKYETNILIKSHWKINTNDFSEQI